MNNKPVQLVLHEPQVQRQWQQADPQKFYGVVELISGERGRIGCTLNNWHAGQPPNVWVSAPDFVSLMLHLLEQYGTYKVLEFETKRDLDKWEY